ncbi:MAG: sodium:solute symporter [Prevotella sp.]|nr:sodium:solute symporter [Prevotella sp.]
MIIIICVILYFVALTAISRWSTKRASNAAFFRGERRSPWWMVAFGMVGASISGVTFVSVPGMVLSSGMTYLQLCMGFIFGYVAVAFVLLPVYYKLNLTTIYSYLGQRLGRKSYLTGAWFFLLSKMAGAALKFYVVCMIMQRFVFDAMGVPFWLTAALLVALIWLYTRRGGIRTLVFTDVFQTTCLFLALLLIINKVMGQMDMSMTEAIQNIAADGRSQVFVMDDWSSPQNFWKQLLSGMFIVIVMTGLDQDMIQKNLTCRTLRDAQKDMCTYGVAFLPANLLFLALGVMLAQLFEASGVTIPAKGDEMLPLFVSQTGGLVAVLFVIGIMAASFSSADSALTSLTTSYCVDIRDRQDDERLRHRVHIIMCLVFVTFILLFDAVNSKSLIDAIYTIVSYTYGPLLGLFAFGLFTKRAVRDAFVPYVCVAAPLLCYALDGAANHLWGYRFGYELLLVNGLLTFTGLFALRRKTVSLP